MLSFSDVVDEDERAVERRVRHNFVGWFVESVGFRLGKSLSSYRPSLSACTSSPCVNLCACDSLPRTTCAKIKACGRSTCGEREV